MIDPTILIETLQLQPHPEGGWYRETWRTEANNGKRESTSAIYYLLENGQSLHWHRIDAQEMWLWHAGHPISLKTAPADTGPVARYAPCTIQSAAACGFARLSRFGQTGAYGLYQAHGVSYCDLDAPPLGFENR